MVGSNFGTWLPSCPRRSRRCDRVREELPYRRASLLQLRHPRLKMPEKSHIDRRVEQMQAEGHLPQLLCVWVKSQVLASTMMRSPAEVRSEAVIRWLT